MVIVMVSSTAVPELPWASLPSLTDTVTEYLDLFSLSSGSLVSNCPEDDTISKDAESRAAQRVSQGVAGVGVLGRHRGADILALLMCSRLCCGCRTRQGNIGTSLTSVMLMVIGVVAMPFPAVIRLHRDN